MKEAVSQILGWAGYLRDHPLIAAGIAVALVVFYLASTWKPKHTRDAESRLKEIRDETHDFYRHLRPPGR